MSNTQAITPPQQGTNNCLIFFRYLASTKVLLQHLQIHLDLHLPNELYQIIQLFLGLPVFFMVSGYVFYLSLSKQREWKSFFKKRLLRLYPELWVCLIIELVSVGIFYNAQVPLFDYIKFAFTQGTVFQFWTPDSLRAYGCGVPNGSLWTMTIFVQFYILIYFIFNWIKKMNAKGWAILFLSMLSIPIFVTPFISKYVPEIASKLMMQTVFQYFWIFMIGMTIAKFKDTLLPILKRFWYIPLVIAIFFHYTEYDVSIGRFSLFKILTYGMFMFGFAHKFPKLQFKTDISFGIYLYHMIFVNIVIQLGYTQNWHAYIIVIILSVLFAYLSYLTVGNIYRKKKHAV